MRLSDAMTPARGWEEAAMLTAQPRTISGGAALNALREAQRENDRILQSAKALPVSAQEPENAQKPAGAVEALKAPNTLRRAAFHQAMRAWQLTREDLRYIYIALIVIAYADAYLGPLAAQDVGAVACAAHKGGFGLVDRGMVGNVLTNALIAVAKAFEHGGHIAIGRGLVRKVAVGFHIAGFDARDAAKLLIQGQSSQSICFPVSI